MSGFSAEWLQLREPFDHAARGAAARELGLYEALAAWRQRGAAVSTTAPAEAATACGVAGDAPFQIVDLACGSGSTLRHLAPGLGGRQHWRLLDHDPALLAVIPSTLTAWAQREGHTCHASTKKGGGLHIGSTGFDLSVSCEQIDLAGQLDQLDLSGTQLLTASALFDLVSASWLSRLLERAGRAGVAMLFALHVDGRTDWLPSDPDDEAVHQLFTAHQGRDKGFGPALGPAAVGCLTEALKHSGYAVRQARSDWLIDGAQGDALHRALLQGMAAAAMEQDAAAAPWLQAWLSRRQAAVPHSSLRVGHADVLAWPAQA